MESHDSNFFSVAARPRLAGAALAALLACLAFATPPSAQGARIHSLEVNETLPERARPFALGLDQQTHQAYVTTFNGPGEANRLLRLEPDGQIDEADPELSGPPGFAPFEIAVDNSGLATQGYLYATDTNGTVQQFDAGGAPTSVAITEASVPADGAPQSGGLPPVINNGYFGPSAVAVDDSGNVFVLDDRGEDHSNSIYEFTSSGDFVAQLAGGEAGCVKGMASDSSGHLYVASECPLLGAPEPLGEGLLEIDVATGECVPASCEPIDPRPVTGVAFDAAAGTLFTIASVRETHENGKATFTGRLREYDAATGNLLGVTRPPELVGPSGVVVDEASGQVIVADTRPFDEATVKIFGPALEVPTAITGEPEEVTDRSATLTGEINAEEGPEATCYFQYVDQKGFEAERWQGAPRASCQPEGPFTGEAWHGVEAELEDLRGGTTYHERIVGVDENGINPGEDIPFTTGGPTVSDTEAIRIGEGSATLAGTVDPRGLGGSYAFQYLTLARLEAGGWGAASEVPAGGAALSASGPQAVSAPIEGLVPGTAYRFRLHARSSDGPSEGETAGPTVAFSTYAPSAATLPDERRWEQVSPLDKNGGNAEGELNAVHASPDGEAITYFSSAGFPVGEGAQQYPSYLSRRSPDGWSTRGLLPPASYGQRAEVLGFSEDLSEAFGFASRPVGGSKLLRRVSASGSVEAIGSSSQVTSAELYAFAGSSQNGVALLESKYGGLLPSDREGAQNVYVYDRGSGRLVLAGVMNDGAPPAGGAMAGPYDWWYSRPTEFGGALNKYAPQEERAISADGSKIFFTAGGTAQLYARLNPLAPQSAMIGEACAEAAKACTIRISAPEEGVADPETPAAFVGASADGRLAYFLDRGRLTEDSTAGPGYDLYRYDLAGGTLTDLTVDNEKGGAAVEGMVGVSEDGSRAYFVASGALAEGASRAPVGETNLYALAGDEIEFVTRLGTDDEPRGTAENWRPETALPGMVGTMRRQRLSPDGRTLLLSSKEQLTAYRNHGQPELYIYRAGQGLSCISCIPTGEAPSGPSGVQEIPINTFKLRRNLIFDTHNLSADGRRVVFDSVDRLLSADHNDVNDVYEWEAKGKGSCEAEAVVGGCLFLISSGAAEAEPTYFADADREGENVFVFTPQRLVAQDKDELVDVYDARVGGGIASQNATPAPPCEAEGCLGSAPSTPTAPSPASSAFMGPGNLATAGSACAAPARRAARLARRAKAQRRAARRLARRAKRTGNRRRAHRTGNPRRAHRLARRAHRTRNRRRAHRLARRAHRFSVAARRRARAARRLSHRARRCRTARKEGAGR